MAVESMTDREQALTNLVGVLLHKAGLKGIKTHMNELRAFAKDMHVRVKKPQGSGEISVTIEPRSIALPDGVDILASNRGRLGH